MKMRTLFTAGIRFKRDILGKENYYKNHFSLPEEHREFFEDFFDIEMSSEQ